MSERDMSYEELLVPLQALERENADLRECLGIGGSAHRSQDLPSMDRKPAEPARSAAECDQRSLEPSRKPEQGIHKYSSPQEKITLFHSLFRGREDVFALRWQSAKAGKSGYSTIHILPYHSRGARGLPPCIPIWQRTSGEIF